VIAADDEHFLRFWRVEMLRRVAALALSCLALAPMAAAAETVRIAHQQHFPPFIETKDGKSTGLVIDIVRAAATKAGLDVVFVAVPFEQFRTRSKTAAPMQSRHLQSRRNVLRRSTSPHQSS
jgi:Bacterial extracellular solute-binding proteins, family 3